MCVFKGYLLYSHEDLRRSFPTTYGLPDVQKGQMAEEDRLEENKKLAQAREESRQQAETEMRKSEAIIHRHGMMYLALAALLIVAGIALMRL